ncbi:MAG: hypothetical protein ACRDRK_04490, partial [Pseudonocardia sp.]
MSRASSATCVSAGWSGSRARGQRGRVGCRAQVGEVPAECRVGQYQQRDVVAAGVRHQRGDPGERVVEVAAEGPRHRGETGHLSRRPRAGRRPGRR